MTWIVGSWDDIWGLSFGGLSASLESAASFEPAASFGGLSASLKPASPAVSLGVCQPPRYLQQHPLGVCQPPLDLQPALVVSQPPLALTPAFYQWLQKGDVTTWIFQKLHFFFQPSILLQDVFHFLLELYLVTLFLIQTFLKEIQTPKHAISFFHFQRQRPRNCWNEATYLWAPIQPCCLTVKMRKSS